MTKLTEARQNLEDVLARISQEENRAKEKLERAREKEIAQATKAIDKKYEAVVKESEKRKKSERDAEEQKYCQRASMILYEQLIADYSALQERTNLFMLRDDELQLLQNVFSGLETISESARDEARKAIMTELGLTSEMKFPVIQREVYSYIAPHGKEVCLVLPVNGEKNDDLAKTLNTKIEDILNIGSITLGTQINVDKSSVVEGSSAKTISFSHEKQFSNGFAGYIIKPQKEFEARELAVALAEKFNQLQPEELKKVRLTHNVRIVDDLVLAYFVAHKPKEMKIPEEDIEKLVKSGKLEISVNEAAVMLGKKESIIKKLATEGHLTYNSSGKISTASLNVYLSRREGPILEASG